jgi:hypothetical protein
MAKINFAVRKENVRATRKTILIVCEGARTEPFYFESFRLSKKVVSIKGVGKNTLSIVEDAVTLNKQTEFDETWCVFDRDSFPPARVSAAFALAKQHKYKIAFSNESFELWYLLHFCYMDAKITRKQYCGKLTEYLGFKYEKNCPKVQAVLLEKQGEAIKRARKLEKNHIFSPGQEHACKPTTSVYKLVERLNGLIKQYKL